MVLESLANARLRCFLGLILRKLKVALVVWKCSLTRASCLRSSDIHIKNLHFQSLLLIRPLT